MRISRGQKSSGAALISMLLIMALMMIMVLAIILLSRSEMKSADTYTSQVSADAFSQAATNLVISQIRTATAQSGEAWASQPGAIRKYDSQGRFLAGYKLYSDDDMIITRENEFLDDVPERDWKEKPMHWVDLNAPVMRDSNPVFPILDPRAEGSVEGFSFTEDVDGTIKSDGADARLPMPTRWLYLLQDGTSGHLDASSNEFVGFRPDGTRVIPDEENPIVGRVGFWADDETAKININTASEPTFWDTPRSVSFEDQWYARSQPVQREYQRFPGHPATTALSTVLFGGQVERKTLAELDGGRMRAARSVSPEMRANRDIKEEIYKIIPRVNRGGSESGTQIPPQNEIGIIPDEDHLYASLDEFIFSMPESSGGDQREISSVVNRELLERSRFFLTANSRAPELNLFGLPRVSIWPTDSDNKVNQYLTPYDKLIRFCSTSPADHPYYFTRKNADSLTEDWEQIERNREVYEYLYRLTSENVPGVGGDFSSKFAEDHRQILTEIFDYIRTTNLFDDSHPNRATRFTDNGEGRGQVAPIKIGDTMGVGRIVTFSEFAIMFLCAATPGEDYKKSGKDPQKTGGDRIEDELTFRNGNKDKRILYTNFPPLSPTPSQAILDTMKRTGVPFPYVAVEDPNGVLQQPDNMAHPGYQSQYWNNALQRWNGWNTASGANNSTALKRDEMMIQAAFVPEAFVPGQGWIRIHSHVRMNYLDLDGLQINGQPLGFREKVNVDQGAIGSGYHGRNWGGVLGFRQTVTEGTDSAFVKIDTSGDKMRFSATKPVRVQVYCRKHNESPENLVQTINLDFPEADLPLPLIIEQGSMPREGTRRQNTANWWWSFQRRRSGRGHNPGSPWTKENNNSPDTVTRDPVWPQGIHKGGFFKEGDVIRSLAPYHSEIGGDARLVTMDEEVDASVFRPHYAYFDLDTRIDQTLSVPAGAHYYWRYGHADLHKTTDGIYPEFAYRVESQMTDAKYHFSKFPDYPRGYSTGVGSEKISRPINTGDFDNGVSLVQDGPYVNYPDGGNRAQVRRPMTAFPDSGTPYFDGNWVVRDQGQGYFSPNRMINSAVMFGSLPSGVKRNIPWQTLLFRPQPWGHPINFDLPHPGHRDLKDHYLLDLFWMPVVEPYAISEPFSTAGKVNLNYQILPFTHINRATGLHAVMKAEEMLIVSDEAAAHYKNWDHELADYFVPDVPKNVHLRQFIDIDETLKQFEDRFLNGEIFRSASEICEVHLVPLQDRLGQTPLELPEPRKGSRIGDQVDSYMKEFWKNHSPTGDNSRERPYSNIYPRLTTKSNTFRIHVRAQVIKKPRGSDPTTFDPSMDTVAGEWRGSTLVERYIDPNNEDIPDYVTKPDVIGKETLERYYRFRILHRKRFGG